MTALAEIAVFTDDVATASAFYRGVLGDPVSQWPGGTLFAVGGGALLVHEQAAARSDGPPNEDHFAMSVEDLDAVCASLAANGYTFLVEPRDYPWGRSAYLRDPDGRLVELAQA
ncbi:MAG TPA: VOC family protein [Gaiellaceae bacterium]|nr:VOC family protein [Gaiellaceae bacterium]